MAKSKPNWLNPNEVLTTARLIKLLQELDPSGEARITIRGNMGGTLRLPDEVTLEEVYTHKRDAGFAILERYKDESWARGGLNKSPQAERRSPHSHLEQGVGVMELQPNISHWMVQHIEIADPMKPKMANGKILLETLQSVDYIHYETAFKAFTEDETEGVMIRLVAVEQEEDQKFFLTLRQKRVFTEEELTKQRRRQFLGRQLKEREARERRNER